MPTYTHDVPIAGLNSVPIEPKIFQEPGIRAFDASLGSKDIKVLAPLT
jgi:hypothetical protein